MEKELMELEEPQAPASNKREVLRLIVAIFYMVLAMGLLPDMGGSGLFHAILPAQLAPHAYSISVFTASWFILAGQRLPVAASFLIALTLMSQAFVPPETAQFALIRVAVLVAALMLVGGFFDKAPAKTSNPGRIRLTRVKAPRRTRAATAPSGAASKQGREQPFAPVPEELDMLFDQIAEAR